MSLDEPAAHAGLPASCWVDAHRQTWSSKPLLRAYYEEEYFKRIVAAMPNGRSLELGSGPGFFASFHRCDVVSDVAPAPQVDEVVDAHAMPFSDAAFACVVGVDVIHHFYHPAKALREIARVLRPGGRLILIEPWTGPVGIFVNKYLHSEDCFPLHDPWGPVFTDGKDPMCGNATIPKTLFVDYARELPRYTGVTALSVTPFSCFGFLSTGGFTTWRLPFSAGRLIMAAERKLPSAVWPFLAIKMFIVAEKTPYLNRE